MNCDVDMVSLRTFSLTNTVTTIHTSSNDTKKKRMHVRLHRSDFDSSSRSVSVSSLIQSNQHVLIKDGFVEAKRTEVLTQFSIKPAENMVSAPIIIDESTLSESRPISARSVADIEVDAISSTEMTPDRTSISSIRDGLPSPSLRDLPILPLWNAHDPDRHTSPTIESVMRRVSEVADRVMGSGGYLNNRCSKDMTTLRPIGIRLNSSQLSGQSSGYSTPGKQDFSFLPPPTPSVAPPTPPPSSPRKGVLNLMSLRQSSRSTSRDLYEEADTAMKQNAIAPEADSDSTPCSPLATTRRRPSTLSREGHSGEWIYSEQHLPRDDTHNHQNRDCIVLERSSTASGSKASPRFPTTPCSSGLLVKTSPRAALRHSSSATAADGIASPVRYARYSKPVRAQSPSRPVSCPSSSTTTSSESLSVLSSTSVANSWDSSDLVGQLHAAMSFCSRERVAGQLLETALSSSCSDGEQNSDEDDE